MSSEPKPSSDEHAADRVADRFIGAIERGDLETIKATYAPHAVIWHNPTNRETTAEESLQALRQFVAITRTRQYENRRFHAFDGGFVQQHTVVAVRSSDGARVAIEACIVCKIERGLITRLDEYVDSAAFAPLFAGPADERG